MAWVLPQGPPVERRGRLLPCGYLLGEAAALAEDLVFEHFRLGPRFVRRLQYEVRFLKEDWPFPPEALAVLVKGEGLVARHLDPYWILLPYGRPLPFSRAFLPALLLYIFTHELVHMVRFARYEASYHMKPREKWQEEKLVHQKTREILTGLSFPPGLSETLRYFDQIYGGGGSDAHLRVRV